MNGARRGGPVSGRTVVTFVAAVVTGAVVIAGCGGDDDAAEPDDAGAASVDDGAGEAGLTPTDVCDLLTDGDVESVLGATLPSEPNDYPDESPYPGCSWQTGRLIVQVAPGTAPVTAPGQECDPLDLGDAALQCAGSTQVVVGGSRAIVQTIEDVTPEQLAAIAEIVASKL